jgi:hypothetical protein
LYKDHGSWFTDYQDENGKRVRNAFPTKALALAAELDGRARASFVRAARRHQQKKPVAPTSAASPARSRATGSRSAQ